MNIQNLTKQEMEFEKKKHLFADLPKIKSGQGSWGVSKICKKPILSGNIGNPKAGSIYNPTRFPFQ